MPFKATFTIGTTPQSGKRALQQILPAGWRFAHQVTLDLISQIEHLAWPDRADKLDSYFTQQADGMLDRTRMGSMLGGRLAVVTDLTGPLDPDEHAVGFSVWCRAITTAIMLDLERCLEVREPAQALTYMVARDWHFARSAASWIAENGMAPVADALKRLPGYAMVLLATSPNDTAERFIARDAFWQAVRTKS
jgi:hypothetical protein